MRNLILAFALMHAGSALAAETDSLTVPMQLVDEHGARSPAGAITISESPYGLIFTPAIQDMPPGVHGFHIHQNASCEPMMKEGKPVAALAAGGHWDPAATGKHDGPYGNGHLGDLPALYVASDGTAAYPVLAPRLSHLEDIRGHALMIHAGGDNHSDHPSPLGGGGARLACGVIK
ncbi:superoxide dismutase [Cu-Zn] SodC [uncultured Aquitalea sp.]|uniref:superoxide dismutase [Cu-Zn] SodC n=1 Tax=uncultured Aquitalea sp. TaxID=540272 RepID=UPI0025F63AC5|nr:superoxide dismutase [Cu-Zn] SodC [uncultured Aquitalea sp.]